jgi:hypothetical protein
MFGSRLRRALVMPTCASSMPRCAAMSSGRFWNACWVSVSSGGSCSSGQAFGLGDSHGRVQVASQQVVQRGGGEFALVAGVQHGLLGLRDCRLRAQQVELRGNTCFHLRAD